MNLCLYLTTNVTAGDYKEKAKTPPNAAAVDHKQAQVPTSVNTDAATNPKAAVGTPNNAPAAITTNKDTSDSSKNPLKKAAVGVGAAVAGATAAVAGSHKSGINDNKTGTTTTGSKINNRSAPLPPTPQSTTNSGTTSTTSDVSKLSENVQYCIKSAVQAPSVDVYGIINPSQKVKRPEAAVGPSTQPTMPSSAQAPDVPKKTIKSPEHRHKPSFLKKKNCIIL
ncbi:hypothetical protein G6F42_023093 [Rhizopus arrhizus]|nr:hypothetical protein G6F42_023093 [Rhizopus arrhizus]